MQRACSPQELMFDGAVVGVGEAGTTWRSASEAW